jgi:hypothetical protein
VGNFSYLLLFYSSSLEAFFPFFVQYTNLVPIIIFFWWA